MLFSIINLKNEKSLVHIKYFFRPHSLATIIEKLYAFLNSCQFSIVSKMFNATAMGQDAEMVPQFTQAFLFKFIVLSIMSLLSCVLNSATLWSLYRRKVVLMRSSVYKLMLHMSVADLFVTCACMSGEAVWTYTVEWLAGDYMCKLLKYLQVNNFLKYFQVCVHGYVSFCK